MSQQIEALLGGGLVSGVGDAFAPNTGKETIH
jgi:hypothetical protein